MRATFLVSVLLLSALSFGLAQKGSIRISTCFGMQAPPTGIVLDPQFICGVSGFLEASGFGLFVQTLPRYGPFWDEWEVYGYKPDVKLHFLGQDVRTWPGIAVGREDGAWFVRAQADILISFNLAPSAQPP